MDNIPAQIAWDGATPVPDNAVHTADEYNDRRVELQNSVTISGQPLSAGDPEQLAKAMAINGVAGQSMIDSGTANAKELTPVTGSGGIRVPGTFPLLDGAIYSFKNLVANTTNVTVNVGQTVGTLLGALSLLREDGTQIPADGLALGAYYSVRYDDGAGNWVLMGGLHFQRGRFFGEESIVLPNKMTIKQGRHTFTTVLQVLQTITFATPFPTALVATQLTPFNASLSGSDDWGLFFLSQATTGIGFAIRVGTGGVNLNDGVEWLALGY